jgi:hypothetical protein
MAISWHAGGDQATTKVSGLGQLQGEGSPSIFSCFGEWQADRGLARKRIRSDDRPRDGKTSQRHLQLLLPEWLNFSAHRAVTISALATEVLPSSSSSSIQRPFSVQFLPGRVGRATLAV